MFNSTILARRCHHPLIGFIGGGDLYYSRGKNKSIKG
jgi:hypothetical protein